MTGGTSTPGNNLTSLRINNVDILVGPIAHTGDNIVTASNIATAVNNLTSTPNYSATSSNTTVTITAVTRGTSQNGLSVVISTEGDFTTSDLVSPSNSEK